MEHAFKTPTLRDVARRGPYLHDGSLATLSAVIEHYDRGGIERPSLSPEIKPLRLDAQEKSDLVDFMLTLSGENPPVQLPVLFPGPQATER
jgi:cytochrome c peroxidase